MKYMLMMNTPGGGPYQIASWPAEDIKAHIAFMMRFGKKLSAAGELVGAEGLSGPGPGEAGASGRQWRTDHRRRLPGVEGVPGGLLDRGRRDSGAGVRDRRRGIGGPGPGGKPLNMAIEVRQVMSGPPAETGRRDPSAGQQRSGPAARSRAAGSGRARFAAIATSAAARTRCRRRSSPRRRSGRHRGCPTTRKAG